MRNLLHTESPWEFFGRPLRPPLSIFRARSADLNGTLPFPTRPRSLSEFHKFPDLPIELRLKIWNHTIDNSPRIFEIDISHTLFLTCQIERFYLNAKNHEPRFPFLPPNRECRDELFRNLDRVEFFNAAVFINFERDIIYLSRIMSGCRSMSHRIFTSDAEELVEGAIAKNEIWKKVKNLAVARGLLIASLQYTRWNLQEPFSFHALNYKQPTIPPDRLVKFRSWVAERRLQPAKYRFWLPFLGGNGLRTLSICYGDDHARRCDVFVGRTLRLFYNAPTPRGLIEFHSFDSSMPSNLLNHLINSDAPVQISDCGRSVFPDDAAYFTEVFNLRRISYPADGIPEVEFKFVTRGGLFRSDYWNVNEPLAWDMSI